MVDRPSLERQQRDALRVYFAALKELTTAMLAFNANPPPMGERNPPTGWTPEHVRIMQACAQAWPAIVEARRRYDTITRELRQAQR